MAGDAMKSRRKEVPLPAGSWPKPVSIPGVKSFRVQVDELGYNKTVSSVMTQDSFWSVDQCTNQGCTGSKVSLAEIRQQIESRQPIKGSRRCNGREAAGQCHRFFEWKGEAVYADPPGA